MNQSIIFSSTIVFSLCQQRHFAIWIPCFPCCPVLLVSHKNNDVVALLGVNQLISLLVDLGKLLLGLDNLLLLDLPPQVHLV